jgi:hypothetical protein
MEGGVLRRKRRLSRRPGFPIESRLLFYPRYALETARKAWRYWRMYANAARIVKKVENDPKRWDYTDLAIQPVRAEDLDTFDLFHETAGGEAFLARKASHDAIIDAAQAAHQTAAA